MIVVDSSALVDALGASPGTEELCAFLLTEDLHAPALVDFEVVAALRGLTLGGHISAVRAQDLLSDFDDLRVQRWPALDVLRRRAFDLRDSISAYDAAYVALAEQLDCPLLTRDARLARSSGHYARIVVH